MKSEAGRSDNADGDTQTPGITTARPLGIVYRQHASNASDRYRLQPYGHAVTLQPALPPAHLCVTPARIAALRYSRASSADVATPDLYAIRFHAALAL